MLNIVTNNKNVRFLIKRLLQAIFTIFIISLLSFIVIQAPPGDFATNYEAALTLDPDVPVHDNELIFRAGKCVGTVRRGGKGFSINKSICYGYIYDYKPIKIKDLKKSKFQIETIHGLYDATFHNKTLFDPDGLKIKTI